MRRRARRESSVRRRQHCCTLLPRGVFLALLVAAVVPLPEGGHAAKDTNKNHVVVSSTTAAAKEKHSVSHQIATTTTTKGGLTKVKNAHHQSSNRKNPPPLCVLPERKRTQPFVMWMDQRVGSTWELDLLNSHPAIVAIGEPLSGAPWTESCSFYRGEKAPGYSGDAARGVDPRDIRARGYKVKLFGCLEAGVHAARRGAELTHANATQNPTAALAARCVGPNAPFAALYDLWVAVGAKVVCAVRRNAVERALSIVVKDTLRLAGAGGSSENQNQQPAHHHHHHHIKGGGGGGAAQAEKSPPVAFHEDATIRSTRITDETQRRSLKTTTTAWCATAGANLKASSDCAQHLSEVSLRLDVRRVVDLASFAESQHRLAVALCGPKRKHRRLKTLILEYDDVAANASHAMRPVLEFLGLDPADAADLTSDVVRIGDADKGVKIANDLELAAAFRGTRYEHWARHASVLRRAFAHIDFGASPSSDVDKAAEQQRRGDGGDPPERHHHHHKRVGPHSVVRDEKQQQQQKHLLLPPDSSSSEAAAVSESEVLLSSSPAAAAAAASEQRDDRGGDYEGDTHHPGLRLPPLSPAEATTPSSTSLLPILGDR